MFKPERALEGKNRKGREETQQRGEGFDSMILVWKRKAEGIENKKENLTIGGMVRLLVG